MLTDPNQRATTMEIQGIIEISAACWRNREKKLKIIKKFLETKTVTPITISQTTTPTIMTTTTKTVTELKGSQKLFINPLRHVARRTTPQRDVLLEPMQQTGPFPGRENQKNRVDIINRTHRTVKLLVSRPQPNILTRNATSSLRNCEWQTGDHQMKIPVIPVVVWQQFLETSVDSSS